jgi:hypothetical protein
MQAMAAIAEEEFATGFVELKPVKSVLKLKHRISLTNLFSSRGL